MKKITALLLCVLLGVVTLAGCGGTQEASQSEAPSASALETTEESVGENGISLEDMSGEKVEIARADRIVSLTPAGTEIVCALGAEKRLVGVDAFSDYPEITGSLEVVGDFNGPDVEKVVSLEPDVVLAGNSLQQEAIDRLKTLGITVVSVEATAFEDIPKSIELVGAIVDAREEAARVIGDIEKAADSARENKPEAPPSVYYAMSYGDSGNWTSGPGSFINEMIELAGGVCVTADAPAQWVEYSAEDLAVANPDIILLASDGGDAEGLGQAQGFADLDAVKNGKVHVVDANVISRPGPRIADALATVSELINE